MEIPVVSQLQSTEILGKASPALVDISTPGNNVLVAVDANRIVWTVDVSETDNETSVSSQLQVPVIKGHLPQDADEHSVFSFPYLTCIVATTDGFLLSDSSSNVLSYVRSNVDKASVESPAWEFNGYLKVSSFNDEKAMMVQLTPSCLCYTPFDERITIVVGSPVPLWTMPCLDYKNLSSGVPNRMSELLSLSDREFERCAKAEYERGALPSPFDSAHSSNHMIYPGSAIGILPYELTTVSRSDTFRVIQPVWITDCAHAGRITSLSVPSTCGNSMQTKYMTSCSRDDGTIKIWDMVTRKPILSKCYPWPSAPLRVALHPSGFFLAVYFPGRLHVFVITMASPNITVDDSGADFNQQREEELKNLETFREANRAATKNWNDCFLQWKSYSSRILGMDLASMSSIEMTGIHVIRWSTKGDRIAVSIGTKLYVYQFLNHTPSLFLEDFASCVVGKDLSILGKRGGSRNTLHKQNFPYFFLMGILDASPKAVEDFCFGLEDQYIFVISSDGSQSTFDLRDLVACSSGCVEGDDARSTVDLKGARDDTVAEKSRVWFDETLSPVIYPCGEFSSESGYQTYTSNSVFIDTPPWAAEGGQLSLIPEDVKQADKQNDGPRRGILVSHSHYVSDNSNLTKVFLDGKFSEVRSKEYSQESLREAQTNPIGRCSTICGLCLPYFLRGKQYLSSSVPPFSIALWGGTGQGSIVQLCYPQEETKRPAGGRRRSSVQSTEVGETASSKAAWSMDGIFMAEKCHSGKSFTQLPYFNPQFTVGRSNSGITNLHCTSDGTFLVSSGSDGSIFLYLVDAVASARWLRLGVPIRSPVERFVGIDRGAKKESMSSRLRTSYKAALTRWQRGIYVLAAGVRELRSKFSTTSEATALNNIQSLLESEEQYSLVPNSTFREWESWLFRLRSGNNRLHHDFDQSLDRIREDYNENIRAIERRYEEKYKELERDKEMNNVQLQHTINDLKSKVSAMQQDADSRERDHELGFQEKLSGAQKTIEKLLNMVEKQKTQSIENLKASQRSAEAQQEELMQEFKAKVKEQAKEIEKLRNDLEFSKEQHQRFMDELEKTNDDEIVKFRALLDKAAKETKQARNQAHSDIAVLKGQLSSAKAAEKESEEAKKIEAGYRKENAAQVEKLSSRLVELQRENQQLHISLRSRDQQLAQSEANKRELESDRENLQNQVYELRSRLEPAERNSEMLKQQIRDLNEELTHISEEQQRRDATIKKSERQSNSLSKQKGKLESDMNTILNFVKRFQQRLCEFEDRMPFTPSEWEYVFKSLYDEFVISVPLLSSQLSAFDTAKTLRRQQSSPETEGTEVSLTASPMKGILERKSKHATDNKEVSVLNQYYGDTTPVERGKSAGLWASKTLQTIGSTDSKHSKGLTRSAQTLGGTSRQTAEKDEFRESASTVELPAIYDSILRGATEINQQRQSLLHTRQVVDKQVEHKNKVHTVQQKKMVDQNLDLLTQLNQSNYENSKLKERIASLEKQVSESQPWPDTSSEDTAIKKY
eukprot:gb/GECG01010716.1/.p1 GENE.gb/GECG01010716.1/~~gb/GECG01010716.1/.p1  ORF type:complete len:1510 (+),score=227.79 gb/GECG01010716.1/:1-4530(+)